MKAKTMWTVALCLVAAAVCLASNDAQMGMWKLNEAKSKIAAGAPKNNEVIYEAAGDSVKVTIDGMAPDGTPAHTEWTGKLDGNAYPSTGSPNEDMRSYKVVDDHTLQVVLKKGGKVVLTGQVVVSADGKTRTVTTETTDAQGKRATSTAVYDKQ